MNKKTEEFGKQNLNLHLLLSMTMADIDIFLLKEEDQITDKNKMYSKEEIREQLTKTVSKVVNLLEENGCNVHQKIQLNLS